MKLILSACSLFSLMLVSVASHSNVILIDTDVTTSGVQASRNVGSGDSVNIAIAGDLDIPINAIQLGLSWDDSILELVSYSLGDLFSPAHSISSAPSDVSAATGSIAFVLVNISDPVTEYVGTGAFLFLEFVAVGEGTSILDIFDPLGADSVPQTISFLSEVDGTVNVVAEPISLSLLGFGLLAMVVVRRRTEFL